MGAGVGVCLYDRQIPQTDTIRTIWFPAERARAPLQVGEEPRRGQARAMSELNPNSEKRLPPPAPHLPMLHCNIYSPLTWLIVASSCRHFAPVTFI